MFCRLVRNNLLAYHDGELPGFVISLIRRHLLGCEQCQRAYEQLTSLDSELVNLAAQADAPTMANPSKLIAVLENMPDTEAKARRSADRQAVSGQRGQRRFRMAVVTVCALACLLLLPGVMPQVLVTFADVPVIGEWIQRAVVNNAGLQWAYENGYVLQEPIKLQAGEYEMTILGYVADPVQTAVITLVNGPDLKRENGESLYHVTLAVPDSVCWSNSAPLETPLGGLNVVYASPLPAGGSDVEIEMRLNGETVFNHQLFITPEPIAKASTAQQLTIAHENDLYGYSLDRLVATPSQYMLELTYRNLQIKGAQLEMSTGEMLADTYPIAYGNADGSWRKPMVFQRLAGEPVAAHLQAFYWQPVVGQEIKAGILEPLRIGDDERWVKVQVPSWALDREDNYQEPVPSGKSSRPETNFSIVVTTQGYGAYTRGLLVEWELLTADGQVLTQGSFEHHAVSDRGGDFDEYVEHVKVTEGVRIGGLRIRRVAVPTDPIIIPLK